MTSGITEINDDLLEIQPQQINFTFELGKQSSCTIELTNHTNHHVAFQTTNPNKYGVIPNLGILKPNSICDITATMLAQSVAPPDLRCKDMFQIQGTMVHRGTAEEDITSNTFSKESGKYIEEKIRKIFLTRAPQSPVLDGITATGIDDFEDMKSKINFMDSKLKKLTQVWSKETLKTKYITDLTQENDELQHELAQKMEYTMKLTKEKDKLQGDLAALKAKYPKRKSF
ncbi:hypothetical protein like AT4G00170 [Hibiscus trionum]|uniref:MSP domain-containing protein n=1 Tax=Hibiscus trionum TaxID=183268 RepID=A0A9W7LXZ0_HIBTR|nr:hypothetical protein like AT4G00170 [Hibiscus trionum]